MYISSQDLTKLQKPINTAAQFMVMNKNISTKMVEQGKTNFNRLHNKITIKLIYSRTWRRKTTFVPRAAQLLDADH